MPTERNLTPTVIALIAAKVVYPALFLFADFPAGARRLWTGNGPYTDDEMNTWQGIGGIVKLDSFSETVDSGAQGTRVQIDGLSPDIMTKLREQPYTGRTVYAKLGFWNESKSELAFVTEPIWKGTLDRDESERSRKEVGLVLFCEHRLADILRKREWRYTKADQDELRPPGTGETRDTGLDQMEMIQDLSVPWGKQQT